MELLVVIAIISMLMAILIPATGKSREAARRAVCMSNIRSIGQALHTYANSNEGLLVPGDGIFSWEVWAKNHKVNLGHLMSKELDVPASDDHVFFCPSMRTPEGGRGYKQFAAWWNTNNYAPITYMYNNALDGFPVSVEDANNCNLAHRDRANFLLGDGSVNFINLRPMVFDTAFGLESIPEVCTRYNVSFPTIMLFNWFQRGQAELSQARDFLNCPQTWAQNNATVNDSNNAKPVLISSVAGKALVADIVGGWGFTNKPG